jgi:hypothetical protein
MLSFYPAPAGASSPAAGRPADLLRRKPERVTITLNWALRQRLQSRADEEGRSLSNLLAHLLETSSAGKAGVRDMALPRWRLHR